ncbi:MAG: PEGA domain-containing protein [Gallionellaceae bacterium]
MSGQWLFTGAQVQLDGQPFESGERISIGSHRLVITNPEAESFSTNLCIWYGQHDLGEIKLKRSTGTLNVKATPPASTISIVGPEFSTNLYNTAGINLTVPTDQYVVRAEYPHWSQSQNPIVFANLTASCVFVPRFGALHLTCNKDDATYRLESDNGQFVDSGNLPATVVELPTSSYRLTIGYHNRQTQESAVIEAGVTNEMPIQFVLGAAQLETAPPGADVHTSEGDYLGQTPLLLPDITPQTAQFNLSLSGYQPVSVALDITADQTNSYGTNLVSIGYVSAMQEARVYLAASNYEGAVQAAGAALNAKPDDADALTVQNEANKHLNAERQRVERLTRSKRAFDSLCADYRDANLFEAHELTTSKPAAAVAEAIVGALTNSPGAFEIRQDNLPEPETYVVVGRHTFSLGILGGTERDCLLVVGRAKDDETQIWFKVLEYQVQHTVTSNGLLNYHDNKQLIAVSPSRMQMNDLLLARVQEGVQIVTERIRQGIEQASTIQAAIPK